MTKVLEDGDIFRQWPVPLWVGVWRCNKCGALSDIGEDWKHNAGAWRVPVSSSDPGTLIVMAHCPKCWRQMYRNEGEQKLLYPSAERSKATTRRKYPTLGSKIKRWFR